jgi:hypothetical protein
MSIILKGRNIEGSPQCLEASHPLRHFTLGAQSHVLEDACRMATIGSGGLMRTRWL